LLRGPLTPGGAALVTAYRQTTEPSLVIAVSLSEYEMLSDWRREVTGSLLTLIILSGGTAVTWFVLFRQIDGRNAAEQALSRAQRLESIGRLTGGVAHDFNNLLTVILGNASLLKENPDVARHGSMELTQIEDAAQRAADLTRRLLAFARQQPLRPETVDVSDLVRNVHPMLTRLLGKHITFTTRLSAEPCMASVDVVQVESALMNLCVNARDAMPSGGVLGIETGDIVFDAAYAKDHEDVTPGRHVMIAVSDSGTGIAQEHLGHIFEPFYTTKSAGKGTGLGLSMVYGLIKQSRGHVRVYSEVGRGTAFKLYFPAATSAPSVLTSPSAVVETTGQGQRILVVEDEDGVRRLAVRLLTGLGYQVTAAASAAEALERVRQMPAIDLLLTDIVLPEGRNGLQLAEELSRMMPGLPVLFASGYSVDILQHGDRLAGAHLITKPYDRAALANAVRAALEHRLS
jgi:signal transduction histidine kinase/ActR/RegA family two-component response regulator